MNLDQIMSASPEELSTYNKKMLKKAAVRFVVTAALCSAIIVGVDALSKKYDTKPIED